MSPSTAPNQIESSSKSWFAVIIKDPCQFWERIMSISWSWFPVGLKKKYHCQTGSSSVSYRWLTSSITSMQIGLYDVCIHSVACYIDLLQCPTYRAMLEHDVQREKLAEKRAYGKVIRSRNCQWHWETVRAMGRCGVEMSVGFMHHQYF